MAGRMRVRRLAFYDPSNNFYVDKEKMTPTRLEESIIEELSLITRWIGAAQVSRKTTFYNIYRVLPIVKALIFVN